MAALTATPHYTTAILQQIICRATLTNTVTHTQRMNKLSITFNQVSELTLEYLWKCIRQGLCLSPQLFSDSKWMKHYTTVLFYTEVAWRGLGGWQMHAWLIRVKGLYKDFCLWFKWLNHLRSEKDHSFLGFICSFNTEKVSIDPKHKNLYKNKNHLNDNLFLTLPKCC